jgi:hypothetical protein
MIKKKSKAQRIRELLQKGKSAHYISNTLNVKLQSVYNVRWHMKNQAVKADAAKAAEVRVGEATIILPTPPKQIELDFTKLDEVVNQHQAHIKAHVDALNNRSKTESIQGEYGKYQQMSTWQRIKFNFKSALGF